MRQMKLSAIVAEKRTAIPWLAVWAVACVVCLLLPLPILSRAFFAAAVSNFLFCALYYGNIYNLPGIFASIFLLQIGCSQAKLTAVEQCDFSRSTWTVLLAVLAAFYAVVFLMNRLLHLKGERGGQKFEFRMVLSVMLFLNIACLVIEAAVYIAVYCKLGTVPLFDDAVRSKAMPELIGNVGITFMVLPQFMIMLNMAYCVERNRYWLSLFSVVFLGMLVTIGARINVFIPVIVCLVMILVAMYRYKKRFWQLLATAALSCVVTVLLMLGIPLLRTSSYVPSTPGTTPDDSSVVPSGQSYYEKIYSDASMNEGQINPDPNYGIRLPSVALPVWVNFSTELYGFNNMVNTLDQTQDFQYGKCFLTGTLNFLFKNAVEKPNSTELSGIRFITVCTFLMEPYHDFGMIGAVLFVALYTALGLFLYQRMMKKNSLFSVMYYSYYCMIAMMFIFVNHMYYSTFIVNTILIALCCFIVSVDWKAKIFGNRKKQEEQAEA